ncbi:hypothetical protein DOTSEDRAFT_75443 [Dothistroma septosporum NZE10]|uniref:Uncharacterized protein n=1 Tax=Dothistroma septosporum (strain NZE10 / CBS 128990) TaxID=675120 RepID=M2XGS8_DOTSN|nr:hypothetical protein DOTSEDRAFT_75443 [Dothistroma septosporum NZE10]
MVEDQFWLQQYVTTALARDVRYSAKQAMYSTHGNHATDDVPKYLYFSQILRLAMSLTVNLLYSRRLEARKPASEAAKCLTPAVMGPELVQSSFANDLAMVEGKVILYDCPSRFGTGTCWSPNTWKTRLLLNFKGIPYETKWIHGPFDGAAAPLGIEPHDPTVDAIAPYTIPFVTLSDGRHLMDSKKIAAALEAAYPPPDYPSAHLEDPVVARAEQARLSSMKHLQAILVPRMPRECLSSSDIEFHRSARKKTYGMPLEEYEAKFGGEQAWEKARPGLQSLVEILEDDPNGPFCLGNTPSYADFYIVGMLEFSRCVGGGNLERFFEFDGVFQTLYEACGPWLKRNDH